jgi:hypothetical protein
MGIPIELKQYLEKNSVDVDVVSLIKSNKGLFKSDFIAWRKMFSEAHNSADFQEKKQFKLILKALGLKPVKASLSPLVKMFLESPPNEVLMDLSRSGYKYLSTNNILPYIEGSFKGCKDKVSTESHAEQLITNLIYMNILSPGKLLGLLSSSVKVFTFFYFIRKFRLWIGMKKDFELNEKLFSLPQNEIESLVNLAKDVLESNFDRTKIDKLQEKLRRTPFF